MIKQQIEKGLAVLERRKLANEWFSNLQGKYNTYFALYDAVANKLTALGYPCNVGTVRSDLLACGIFNKFRYTRKPKRHIKLAKIVFNYPKPWEKTDGVDEHRRPVRGSRLVRKKHIRGREYNIRRLENNLNGLPLPPKRRKRRPRRDFPVAEY